MTRVGTTTPARSSRRALVRAALLIACLCLVTAVDDAQRGRGGGRRGGARGGPPPAARGGKPSKPAPPPPIPRVGLAPVREVAPAADGTAAETPLDPGAEVDGSALGGAAEELWIDPLDPELERRYFETCDHDGNGWVSFREARHSLEILRPEYFLYDVDRDGRIQREEFQARYHLIVERIGGFKPPRPPASSQAVDTGQLAALQETLVELDNDGDGAVDEQELLAALHRLGTGDADPESVMQVSDLDGSGAIEGPELVVLQRALKFVTTDTAPGVLTSGNPLSTALIAPLAPTEDQPLGISVPRLPGPLPHFDRLDLDRDGAISHRDLATLQSPLQLRVRTNAVIAALDANGDGELDRAEFEAALE